MTDLLDKLQHATEGSREISEEVLLACGWTYRIEEGVWTWRNERGIRVAPFHGMPDPSRNLQDAVLLIPCDWRLEHLGESELNLNMWECEFHDRNQDDAIQGDATTAPLAVCIAIIKAHESKAEAA